MPKISKSNLDKVLAKHSYAGLAAQFEVLSKAGKVLAIKQKIKKNTIFKQSWSDKKIEDAINETYKDALTNGVEDGPHSLKVDGEIVTVYMKRGNCETAYGAYKFEL